MPKNIPFPKELKAFQKHLSTVSREDMEYFISSLWLRFNVEEEAPKEFCFTPDREVGGGDLVELVAELLGKLEPSDPTNH